MHHFLGAFKKAFCDKFHDVDVIKKSDLQTLIKVIREHEFS